MDDRIYSDLQEIKNDLKELTKGIYSKIDGHDDRMNNIEKGVAVIENRMLEHDKQVENRNNIDTTKDTHYQEQMGRHSQRTKEIEDKLLDIEKTFNEKLLLTQEKQNKKGWDVVGKIILIMVAIGTALSLLKVFKILPG